MWFDNEIGSAAREVQVWQVHAVHLCMPHYLLWGNPEVGYDNQQITSQQFMYDDMEELITTECQSLNSL